MDLQIYPVTVVYVQEGITAWPFYQAQHFWNHFMSPVRVQLISSNWGHYSPINPHVSLTQYTVVEL